MRYGGREPELKTVDDEAPAQLEELDVGARGHATIPLRWDKTLAVESEADRERLLIRGASGLVEVTIEVTPSGCRVLVHAQDLEVRADRELSFQAKTAHFAAENVTIHASEALNVSAGKVAMAAERGSFTVRANDDVKVDGERVLLNCDEPAPVPGWMKRELAAEPETADRTVPLEHASGDADLAVEWTKP